MQNNYLQNTIAYSLIFSSLLALPGCLTYKPVDPSSIQPVKEKKETKFDNNFEQMSWREAIVSVKTPSQAQEYINDYFESDTQEIKSHSYIPGIAIFGAKGETFRYNHKKRKGNCFDNATAAAALLSDDGYPAVILNMKGYHGTHAEFLYKNEKGFGTVGAFPMPAQYQSVDRLVDSYKTIHGLFFSKYSVFNLDNEYPDKTWISGDMDLGLRILYPDIKIKSDITIESMF